MSYEISVKVRGEYQQGYYVHEEADQLGSDHEPVPRDHREGHHDELGQYQGGVADLDYVDQLVLEQN